MIMVDSLEVIGDETFLHASMLFEAPNVGNSHFQGRAKYSQEGGVVSEAVLYLIGDYKKNEEGKKARFM